MLGFKKLPFSFRDDVFCFIYWIIISFMVKFDNDLHEYSLMSICNICHRCHSRSVAQEAWMPRRKHICITILEYYKQALVNILLLCNQSSLVHGNYNTGLTSTLILYLDKVTKVRFEQIFWKELENECKTKSPEKEF